MRQLIIIIKVFMAKLDSHKEEVTKRKICKNISYLCYD